MSGLKCTNHPNKAGRFVCEQCGKAWCEECIVIKTFEAKPIEMCPACGAKVNLVEEPKRRKTTSTLVAIRPKLKLRVEDAGPLLSDWLFPSDVEALGVMLVLSVFAAIGLAIAEFFPGFYLFLVLPGAVFAMNLEHAASGAAMGDDEYRDPVGELPLISGAFESVIKLGVASIWAGVFSAGAVFVLTKLFGRPLSELLASRMFLYSVSAAFVFFITLFLPPAYGALAVHGRIAGALNPLEPLRFYFAGSEGFLLRFLAMLFYVGFLYVLTVLGVFVINKVEIIFLHGLLITVFLMLGGYTLLAFARTVGRFSASVAEPQSEPEPEPEVSGAVPSEVQPNQQAEPVQHQVLELDQSTPAATPQVIDSAGLAQSGYRPFEPPPEAQEQLVAAREFHNAGRLADAEQVYRKLLMEYPEYKDALLSYYELLYSMQRYAEAEEVGKKLLEICHKLQERNLAVRLWREIKLQSPKASFDPEIEFFVAEALCDMQQYQDSATLFRDLARAHPEHHIAPKAILRCAEVLAYNMERPDLGRKIFSYLVQRYPGTSEAQQAQERLSQLEQG